MKELVSVIITTCCGTDTLDRAIKSVLNQTYSNIEVIVVDDNGLNTKNQIETNKIVDKYINSGKDIIYIPHKNNSNGSVARNTGIKAAKGKYIALLDDDDEFRVDKIEKQVEAIQSNENTALCFCGMRIHFQDGRKRDVSNNVYGDIHSEVMKREFEMPSSTLLFDKALSEKINNFDVSFKRHQDWEFVDRLSENNNFIGISDICLDRYIYRRNSAKNPKQYEINRIYYLNKMKPYINNLSKKDKKSIYYNHYKSIAKEYLKSKKIIQFFKYSVKSGNPILVIVDIWHDYKMYKGDKR